jgi:DNA-binding response OmpR family regulator
LNVHHHPAFAAEQVVTLGIDMIILVAEDEALIALVLEVALRLAGHQVIGPAATVEEALRLADETKPELALVDINLYDGDDGVALARTLRDRYGTPSLFLSGQVPRALANRDAALGLIRKPYDPESVLDAVAYVGELRRGRSPGRVPPQLELFRELHG